MTLEECDSDTLRFLREKGYRVDTVEDAVAAFRSEFPCDETIAREVLSGARDVIGE